MGNNFYKAQQMILGYEKSLLKRYPFITKGSGIYILTRVDEIGLKHAYIGQSVHCLRRLAEHLVGYKQHIDKSLRKHKLHSEDKPYGWKVDTCISCSESELDEKEQEYINKYALNGYQLLNKTGGGQNSGKVGIGENADGLGYRKGVAYGYRKAIKEVAEYFEKYLDYDIKPTLVKKDGTRTAISLKKYEEFAQLLKGDKENE